ncbi:stage V sporulation protein AB [Priestia flexa]|jgi:stage V sporulation protein AB|uniref:Stage V sporulation protein AB n=2 Tax=Priestia TaxID=2800373 RepID=A0A0V8JR70_9BACI|nr:MULTISPECIES: stage V sporulation protein AB [Bacillaceae]KSU89556.1 stage V sporulation protein AB [Priestia veravalensis]KZB90146.1 stage V sporulation protein AB [Bacillus sp. VT 712]MBN8250285.1 stage V sporulation protein AB [Priestia flexa]MBN8432893.1 stage V sporulation protein AB [Priestia flexa]MBY6084998.1 stage V sporulation protein AB [Priestia flexa]
MIANIVFTIIVGFASGLAVGGGFVAFLTVLGIIPRLMQLTKTMKYIQFYEWAVVGGAVAGGWCSLHQYTWSVPSLFIGIIGLASGIFFGMLAAALTEMLNVLPILTKRIGMDGKLILLLMAIVLGKVFGSLFHWVYFVNQ